MKGKSARNETFAALCRALPKGFSNIVVERLAAKGIKTTPRNVQYVANGHTSNPDIEQELLDVLDERIESAFESKVKERLAKLGL